MPMNTPVEVLVTLPFPEALVNRIREVSPRLHVTALAAKKPEDVPADVWGRTEVLYTDRIVPEPGQAPKLRWIQFHYAGIDYAAGLPLIQDPDLLATTLSGANASQMAEHALTMMLALGRHLPDVLAAQASAEWPRDRLTRFSPVELRGSTVGIVGYGSIGRQIARLLQPFGAIILATKRDVMHPEDTGYIPEGLGDPNGDLFERLYPIQALRSMLRESDFVIVTIPLTPTTRGLIGPAELAELRPGTFLIDISRGNIIDPAALIEALREKRIAGAALDVFPEEPLPSSSPLWKLPNVIITPHVSGISPHYDERAVDLFTANLERYLEGLPLYNRFDPQKGY